MPEPKSVLVIGAGLSGSVAARQLAEAGHRVTVIDERDHLAGNCHTARDPETGVMVHHYGPHIFHTGDRQVWEYVNRFAVMMPYRHQVKARVGDQVYALPINLHTINQFFGRAMDPAQARAFIAAQSRSTEPVSFEDQGLAFVGPALYAAFFRDYTRKQWGVDPARLPASILKRLPLRFTYDDNYFAHPYQAIPRDGYTAMVAAMLDHPGITVELNRAAETVTRAFDHQVYTGPLDRYFRHRLGRLGYRTLHFEHERVAAPWQGTAVMNYCDADVPHTRITEHMYFAPWEMARFTRSVVTFETSAQAGPGDIPYYPIRLLDDKTLLARYQALAQRTEGVTFLGRLGTYAYLDMDVAIRKALDASAHLIEAFARHARPDVFPDAA